MESWRPEINVLGHNVLQYLFEYALDKNELAPSLAVSRKWIDDTTLEMVAAAKKIYVQCMQKPVGPLFNPSFGF